MLRTEIVAWHVPIRKTTINKTNITDDDGGIRNEVIYKTDTTQASCKIGTNAKPIINIHKSTRNDDEPTYHAKNILKPSQTRRWSRLKPNCYGWRQQKQQDDNNSVEIEAYQKPSWVLASTNR